MDWFFYVIIALVIFSLIIDLFKFLYEHYYITIFIGICLAVFFNSKSWKNIRRKQKEAAEYKRREEERKKQEEINKKNEEKIRLQKLRDADYHTNPVKYKIGRHANSTLALRYGIANAKKRNKRGWVDCDTIMIQKTKRLGKESHYLAKLPDFKDREVVAVIENGTDYVKTFYPKNDSEWFKKYRDLEESLKDNTTFTLKELANHHVDMLKSAL